MDEGWKNVEMRSEQVAEQGMEPRRSRANE